MALYYTLRFISYMVIYSVANFLYTKFYMTKIYPGDISSGKNSLIEIRYIEPFLVSYMGRK